MIDINKEAEEYGWRIKTNTFSDPVKANDLANSAIQDFIAGHNSKATQAKVIKSQIEIIDYVNSMKFSYDYDLHTQQKKLDKKLAYLQQQLEQLEQLENGN